TQQEKKEEKEDDSKDFLSMSDDELLDDSDDPFGEESIFSSNEKTENNMVTCMNDWVEKKNPLIGREAELERTIQVLCRKDKNNPLHVGEPGVGKTALVYGLVMRIVKGNVPPRLKGSRVYQMDLGAMLAGTQYRGDFEKRIKRVMDGIQKEGNSIVYIDEIHNLIGAGRISDGSMDASNMLKPYLEKGDIRFIGSTTYDEYNRYFARSRGIVRRFQQIDIPEPSIEETIDILKGLKKKYEQFHNVTYSNEVIEYAVRASAKYINDRFLPDKAIDLIDEAGAYRELHPIEGKKTQKVDKSLVSEVLAKVCKIDATAMKEENNASLKTLEQRILAKIYGQDEAVKQVVEAIQMAKAGLLDDNKPLASLLFVGPTGVGKTEVARVLAQELGISLVRFDMSEYTEKHAVAKLIGSPAGYVGYEDGGLLTDAIRKSPNCVLLLDEIEKAHQDIYNILLQVMDYARLTDNKGQKADFRNVVLIMTSNAGAQYASRASVGFSGNVSRGEAMLAQVKKTFKPEFINRMSGTVVFHDMDLHMAGLILDKKLRELQDKLTQKNVTLELSAEARTFLLQKGFTREYGAREMDRVIAQLLKPILMREILFGKLKRGGKAHVEMDGEQLKLGVG
ncbi:MAG: AAA family ATPase, partial [Prevotella sp.]|nr:AAA family ATPase [Prevotella sp.]